MNTQDQITEITPPQPSGSGRGQPYQFSPDELRVLKECNRDSFFQRCLPLGTLLGVATYYSVQAGHLKPSPRWGATPKVVVASILGYFIGKISYQAKCAEKIMQLPDSRLGALLRQKKRGGAGFQESLEPGIGPGMSLSPFSNISPADTYSDIGPNTGDFDTSRPDNSGLDDYNRPTVDSNPVFEDDALPPQQEKTTSYDELRRQNREEYQKQRNSFYKGLPPADAPQVKRPSETSTPSQEESVIKSPSVPKRTNIYGDPIE